MMLKRSIKNPYDSELNTLNHSEHGLDNISLVRIFLGHDEIKHKLIITTLGGIESITPLGYGSRFRFEFGNLEDPEWFEVEVPFDPTKYIQYSRWEKDDFEIIFVQTK